MQPLTRVEREHWQFLFKICTSGGNCSAIIWVALIKKKAYENELFCLLKNVRKFNAAGAVEHLHTSMKKRGDSRKIFLESLPAIDPAGWVSKFYWWRLTIKKITNFGVKSVEKFCSQSHLVLTQLPVSYVQKTIFRIDSNHCQQKKKKVPEKKVAMRGRKGQGICMPSYPLLTTHPSIVTY